MRRLWPGSIAGRVTMILITGLVLILCMGAAVSQLSLFEDVGLRRDLRLVQRIPILTSIVSGVPAEFRRDIVAAIDDPDLKVRWIPDYDVEMKVSRDWFTARAERRLRHALEPFDIGRIVVGHGSDASEGDDDVSIVRGGPIRILVELADGSWLSIVAAADWHNPYRLIYHGLILLIVGGGIAALAIWVAQRVTAPLRRFSGAAARLGTDVNAPPLSEAGPREIRDAAQAFNLMQNRIRRYLDDRTLMLAAISHDLRTALTRLKLRTEFIDDSEQRKKALADLDEMQSMLDSTLSLARDDTEAEPQTKVDLASLLQSLCDDIADTGQCVVYEGPPRLVYDCRPVALRRALANLIDNAAAYGHEATVTLIDSSDEIRITVGDRGPGIPEAMREQVFTPFFRLEQSRNRETGGTGLGLTVARTIMRSHGGDITLGDRPGGGLLVDVTLPGDTV